MPTAFGTGHPEMKDLTPRVELGRETRHYGMCYDVGSENVGQPPTPAWQPRDGVNGIRESPKMMTLRVTSPMAKLELGRRNKDRELYHSTDEQDYLLT